MSKITKATLKSLIKNNKNVLYISKISSFNGMTDGVDYRNKEDRGFIPVKFTERNLENTLGIEGAWLVHGRGNLYTEINENGFKGIEVYNCCGTFILAVKK